jgi:uncharacterized protein DUF11
VTASRIRGRRLGAILATALFTVALVPGLANAATPNLTPSFSVIPGTVASGDYVAFRSRITNDDTSTVSQLYLVENSPRDANLTLDSISTSQGTCNTTTTPFVCTLGQLKPHKTATVTAIFKTADVVAPATSYSATESFVFNTTGLGSSSGGDNSHGDSWPSGPKTALVTTNGDFGGRYVLNSNLKIVENSQAISNANPHSTRAYAPVTGIGVTVEDIDCTTSSDPICDLFTTGTTAVSKVNVNDGNDVSGTPGTTLLHFYLQADSSELTAGQTAGNLVVTHVYFDEATQLNATESLSTKCQFSKKSGATPTNAPCITVTNLGGGDLGVDVWTFHNGGLKY